MIILLYAFYVAVCLFLIAVVLLQSGKGSDLASAFGAGGSQSAIGARGATTALSRLTTYSAVLFMVLSLTLAIVNSRDVSVMDKAAPVTTKKAPATPASSKTTGDTLPAGADAANPPPEGGISPGPESTEPPSGTEDLHLSAPAGEPEPGAPAGGKATSDDDPIPQAAKPEENLPAPSPTGAPAP